MVGTEKSKPRSRPRLRCSDCLLTDFPLKTLGEDEFSARAYFDNCTWGAPIEAQLLHRTVDSLAITAEGFPPLRGNYARDYIITHQPEGTTHPVPNDYTAEKVEVGKAGSTHFRWPI